MAEWSTWAVAACGLLLMVGMRVPSLLGDASLLDGDEALVGLMAIEALEAGEFPTFFWGQRYGLSTFEAGFAAMGFAMFGVSDTVLRLSTLLLWGLGWLCFLGVLRNLGGKPWHALLLVCCPAWGFWAMAPRGGYVTAFAATQFAMFWLTRSSGRPLPRHEIGLAGACAALVCFAQPLWLFVLTPLGATLLVHRDALRRSLFGVLGFAVVAAPLWLVRAAIPFSVHAPDLFLPVEQWLGVEEQAARLFRMFSGHYYLKEGTPMGWAGALAGGVWVGLWALCSVRAVWSVIRRRPEPLAIATAAGLWALFLACVPNDGGPRYLLPSACLTAFYVVGEFSRLERRWPERSSIPLLFALLCLIGAGSLLQSSAYPRLRVPEQERFALRDAYQEVCEILQARGVHHAYVYMLLGKWSLAFYAEGQLRVRGMQRSDRRQDWVDAVDQARREGRPTALVVWLPGTDRKLEWLQARDPDLSARLRVVQRQVAIYFDPDDELLRYAGFELE